MLVTTLSSGMMMFVLSSLPPRPTSITATSTSCSANHQKAIPVVISKNDSPSKSFSVKKENTASFAIISGPERLSPIRMILMRSRKSTRWGEV